MFQRVSTSHSGKQLAPGSSQEFQRLSMSYPDAWTAHPGVLPATTSGSVYGNNQVIYPFDIPYLHSNSKANGDFKVEPARMGRKRECMYSCNNPSRIDLINSVMNGNSARYQ